MKIIQSTENKLNRVKSNFKLVYINRQKRVNLVIININHQQKIDQKNSSILHKQFTMYQILIILFCLIRAIVMKIYLKRQLGKKQLKENDSGSLFCKNQPTNQSQNSMKLKQLNQRKRQIESTIQQYNNPSSFAKYSKMQRQLNKLGNQIGQLEKVVKQQKLQANQGTAQPTQTNQKKTLIDLKKKEVQKLHKEISNSGVLFKAGINLALIFLCSYFQSSEISMCASYPLYTICNQFGKVNGAWIFVIATVCFSH